MAITQNISQFPPAPQAGTDTPEEFSSKADAFVAHQAEDYVGEVNTWAGQANTVQTDVNQNATNASISETNANQSAIDASGSASSAGNSASSASTSETNAGLSADQASQSATDAGISETNAGTSETNAGISEANALQSETNAELASDSAQASANYMGEWASGASYLVGQSVTVENVFYACKVANSNLNPPDNPTEWQLSASVQAYAGLSDVSLAGLVQDCAMYWDEVSGFWKVSENWGIESNININGGYIKFPDGTLICSGEETQYPATSSDNRFGTTSGTTYFDVYEKDFPYIFQTPPTQVIVGLGSGGGILIKLLSSTNESFQYNLSGKSEGSSASMNYVAIGRWK